MAALTRTQESVARSWCDPDCVLTLEELAETASPSLRAAAAELRERARYIGAFFRGKASSAADVGYVVDHLRCRADELDGGLS